MPSSRSKSINAPKKKPAAPAAAEGAPKAKTPSSPAPAAPPPAPPKIPEELTCPISFDLFRDPVVISTGHTYERAALLDHFAHQDAQKVSNTCPVTGKATTAASVQPNWVVRQQVSKLLDANPGWTPDGWGSRELGAALPGNDAVAEQQAVGEKPPTAKKAGDLLLGILLALIISTLLAVLTLLAQRFTLGFLLLFLPFYVVFWSVLHWHWKYVETGVVRPHVLQWCNKIFWTQVWGIWILSFFVVVGQSGVCWNLSDESSAQFPWWMQRQVGSKTFEYLGTEDIVQSQSARFIEGRTEKWILFPRSDFGLPSVAVLSWLRPRTQLKPALPIAALSAG